MLSEHPSSAHAEVARRRRIVVTGSTSGVGLALARSLSSRGAHVTLAARDVARAHAVRDAILADGGRADVVELDLADLASVRRAARVIAMAPIDVLVNNAAIAGARGTTRDGFEIAFGTNHLGHHLLTRLLLPHVTHRVVHLGSGSHASARSIAWDRCTGPTCSWTGIDEYATSKLAVTVFHHELTRRLRVSGSSIVSVIADPGNVATRAYRHVPWPLRALVTARMKGAEQGADTPLFCVDGEVEHGAAYVDRRLDTTSAASRCEALGRELWARSEAWVGLSGAAP